MVIYNRYIKHFKNKGKAMDRYIIIDLKDKSITYTNDITINSIDDGGSTQCENMAQLITEFEKDWHNTKPLLQSGKYYTD